MVMVEAFKIYCQQPLSKQYGTVNYSHNAAR